MRKQWVALAAIVAVMLVACAGPAATTAPSAPATNPPTGAPPSATPTAAASADPAALGPIRVGVEAPGGEAYIPTQLTVQRMQDEGYDIEIIQFEDPDVMPQALDSGQIHVNTNSSGQILATVDAGLDVKAITGLTDPEFFMVAQTGFETCESLDGARVGVQGTTGFGVASVVEWIEKDCPGTEPQLIDIAGSENRAIALLEDQIDATALHILRARQLQQERPGDFVLIEGYGSPENVTSAWSYSLTSWIEENPELYEAYVTTFQEVTDDISADPQLAVDEGLATIPDVDPELLTEIMIMWAENGWWTAFDGITREVFDATLAFYEGFTEFENELTFEQVIQPPPDAE